MAFTGEANIQRISDRKFRIVGLSLTAGAVGTIGLSDNPNVDVPFTAPEWGVYETPGLHGGLMPLAASVEVTLHPPQSGQLSVEKDGITPEEFQIVFLNTNELGDVFLGEVYVEFH